MANASVVVHDINYLEQYGASLAFRRQSLEDIYKLLLVECQAQEDNWYDERYYRLREDLRDFASYANIHLKKLDEENNYIGQLVSKLKEL